MKKSLHFLTLFCLICFVGCTQKPHFNTAVGIVGDNFYINGKPTFEGRTWQGISVEGLLPNSRMVQGVFDDYNQETVSDFAYPDTKIWDADRNTDEFIAAMPSWREYGLLAFTINMQGGSPKGYGSNGWINPAYNPDGSIIPEYLERLEKIINRADELGMVVILGYFYFYQDEHLQDEEAVINATRNMTNWILEKGYTNVIIEIANETNIRRYDHEIFNKSRCHELVEIAKNIEVEGRRLLVGTSFGGGFIPPEKVVEASDFILIHGNGVKKSEKITWMVDTIRSLRTYRPMPIVFNEDDHYDFDQEENNFVAATKAFASWGYFDFRREGEDFEEGYQSIPVDWKISSDRKKAFFNKVREIFVD